MMDVRIKYCLAAIAMALLTMPAGAATDDSAGERVAEHLSIFSGCLDMAWENPALIPLRFSSSLTDVGGGATMASDYAGGSFSASTYNRLPSGVVTGNVGYRNGTYRKGVLYDTDDVDLVGPYLLYASGPGTLNKERYLFGGSYTALLGDWNVGVSGSYEAGLSYRAVDPRPKNITGLLKISPAASFAIDSRYLLTASVSYIKYRQSNNLKFVSELGQNTIYHLTGLGNSYGRFEGGGASTYYSGYSLGASLGVMPAENGAYLLGAFGRMKITDTLSDFNNLPLAYASTPEYRFSTGWKGSRFIAGLKGRYQRRRGTENIFGDPVSGQYPRIGSLTLYSRTIRELGFTGRLKHGGSVWGIDADYESLFEQHLSPLRQLERHRVIASLSYQYQRVLPKGGYVGAYASLSSSSPLKKKIVALTAASADLMPVIEDTERIFRIYTSQKFYGDAAVVALFPIKGKWMLGADISYSREIEGSGCVNIAIKLLF